MKLRIGTVPECPSCKCEQLLVEKWGELLDECPNWRAHYICQGCGERFSESYPMTLDSGVGEITPAGQVMLDG